MKVSIIGVILNSNRTIEDAIRSVLNQDYEDIQHMVIDGGSTDGTTVIVDKLRRSFQNKIMGFMMPRTKV